MPRGGQGYSFQKEMSFCSQKDNIFFFEEGISLMEDIAGSGKGERTVDGDGLSLQIGGGASTPRDRSSRGGTAAPEISKEAAQRTFRRGKETDADDALPLADDAFPRFASVDLADGVEGRCGDATRLFPAVA